MCIGFDAKNRKIAGNQFIDVGIAEQNAATITTALAKGGCKPVFATNSTFFQRCYDQIEQEMCITKCPATMIISHASVWGHTNDTHVGFYDIPLFMNIPNLMFLAPTSLEEYLSILDWSIEQDKYPVAIRIPWTKVIHSEKEVRSDYSVVKYDVISLGSRVAIIALGSFFQLGIDVKKELLNYGINATIINPLFISGIDVTTLENLKNDHQLIVTLEDGLLSGGFGSKISQFYGLSDVKVMNKGFGMNIPTVFSSEKLMEDNRLKVEQIVEDILKNLEK